MFATDLYQNQQQLNKQNSLKKANIMVNSLVQQMNRNIFQQNKRVNQRKSVSLFSRMMMGALTLNDQDQQQILDKQSSNQSDQQRNQSNQSEQQQSQSEQQQQNQFEQQQNQSDQQQNQSKQQKRNQQGHQPNQLEQTQPHNYEYQPAYFINQQLQNKFVISKLKESQNSNNQYEQSNSKSPILTYKDYCQQELNRKDSVKEEKQRFITYRSTNTLRQIRNKQKINLISGLNQTQRAITKMQKVTKMHNIFIKQNEPKSIKNIGQSILMNIKSHSFKYLGHHQPYFDKFRCLINEIEKKQFKGKILSQQILLKSQIIQNQQKLLKKMKCQAQIKQIQHQEKYNTIQTLFNNKITKHKQLYQMKLQHIRKQTEKTIMKNAIQLKPKLRHDKSFERISRLEKKYLCLKTQQLQKMRN